MNETDRDATESVFQSGFRHVLVEVIAPALIMLMLGSLLFFAIEVLYADRYEFPVHWVFGLYVFAIVLICRIAITEGLERSRFFAVALMIAVLARSGFGPHWIPAILTWWAASKLVWDCTFMDASRDVTGQGLVSAASERWTTVRNNLGRVWRGELSWFQVMGQSDTDRDTNAADETANPVTRWFKDLIWKRRRKNTPGIWAFFFFIAGLGIFGIGQLFIEPSLRARAFSLRMFAVYVFSGLGLMMFVSLVGLFRYLNQRGTRMPDSIARLWMLTGTVVALLLVGVMLMIPWPNTGFSLSSLIPSFQTIRRVGDQSPLKERGKAEGPEGQGRSDEKGAPGQTGNPSERQGPGGLQGGDQTGNLRQGTPGKESGGNQSGGTGPKPSSGSSQSSSQNQQSKDQQQGGKPPPSPGEKQKPGAQGQTPNPQQSQAGKSESSPPAGKSDSGDQANKNSGAPPSGDSGNKNPPSASDPNRPQKPADKQSAEQTPSQRSDRSSGGAQNKSDPSGGNRQSTPSERSSGKNQPNQSSQSPTTAEQKTAEPSAIGNFLREAGSWLKSILGALLWLLALIVGLFLLVRYRNEIIDAISRFFASLGAWWSRRGQTQESVGTIGASRPAPIQHKRFADYSNPFADKHWTARPTREMVEQTFAAFEALAREAEIPRQKDETPLEFAGRVVERHPDLGRGSKYLAEIYSQVAYTDNELSPDALQPLPLFWKQMTAFAIRRQSPQLVSHDA